MKSPQSELGWAISLELEALQDERTVSSPLLLKTVLRLIFQLEWVSVAQATFSLTSGCGESHKCT